MEETATTCVQPGQSLGACPGQFCSLSLSFALKFLIRNCHMNVVKPLQLSRCLGWNISIEIIA